MAGGMENSEDNQAVSLSWWAAQQPDVHLSIADLVPGDLLLYRSLGQKLHQRLISRFSESPYTHAAIYLGDGKVAHSVTHGGIKIEAPWPRQRRSRGPPRAGPDSIAVPPRAGCRRLRPTNRPTIGRRQARMRSGWPPAHRWRRAASTECAPHFTRSMLTVPRTVSGSP